MKSFTLIGLLLWVALGAAQTQTPLVDPPAVTPLQKLQIQGALKDLTIAQLQAQAAQRAFDDARELLTKLVTGLQIPGYTFNVQTQEYAKVVVPPTSGPPQ